MHFPLLLFTFFEKADGNQGHGRESFDPAMVGKELLFTFIVVFVIYIINYYLLKPFQRHYNLKLKNIILSIVVTLVTVLVLMLIINWIKEFGVQEVPLRRHHDELMFRNFFSSIIVLSSIYIMRLIYQKQTYELEIEKLRIEGLQSKFESLKNQVSPHFLFNSLTALKTLVDESPELAGQYIDHLSQVLRYTLQGNDKQLVTLREEMVFADSYLFLIKMRYGDNLTVQTNLDESKLRLMLPPQTVQTLIENVVKHNEISKRKPLTINISTDKDNFLVVYNKIQKKLTPENGTGIGLSNLSKQFQLLGERTMKISTDQGEFRVEVPLLKIPNQ